MPMNKYKIAVLDDYQNAALESADWSVLRDRADIAVFQDHLADPDAVVQRLLPFDVVCVMRERTPLPRNVIEQLPNLKLIASTGSGNASIDLAAAGDHGITLLHTGYTSDPTIEFTWALILASARHIVTESNSVRSGGWQQTVGTDLRGKTLGVLGLGPIGSQVARIGSAFGMDLIAWSQNMTPKAAKAAGAILVSKDQLFERADILTIHLVLSSRTRGLVGVAELERMKPTARLINASRGPVVEEQALISVLKNKRIASAAIDVFDIEPLPPSHPFRTLDNVLATPHIGYVSHGLYKTFYEDTVLNIRKWLDAHQNSAGTGKTMPKRLEGKTAVVTGGTEGIGLATAKLFVKEGAYVFVTGRRQKELDEAVKAIGSNVSGVQGDIAKLADLDRLYETVSKVKGRIDIVFANAGVGEFVPFGAVTEEHFDKTVQH
jgi:phosphoglycerate dehydrogenase-like enzyme